MNHIFIFKGLIQLLGKMVPENFEIHLKFILLSILFKKLITDNFR